MFNNAVFNDISRAILKQVLAEGSDADWQKTIGRRYGEHLNELCENSRLKLNEVIQFRDAAPDKAVFDQYVADEKLKILNRSAVAESYLDGTVTDVPNPIRIEVILRAKKQMLTEMGAKTGPDDAL